MALQEKNYVPVLAYGGSSDITANQTITSSAAQAFAVGANGATNPVLTINCNTASVATGISVTGAAATARVAVAVTSSETNEGLNIDAKGSGTIVLAGTSTGAITLTTATTCASTLTSTGNFVVGSNKLVVTAASGNTAIAGTLGVTGKITADDVDLASGAIIAGLGTGANGIVLKNLKTQAASTLAGTELEVVIDIGGTPYYFKVYPTSS